jgi:hypothetical protein
MAKTVRYVPTFRAPSEYERQVEEARRRAALAEALAQQQYEPMEGNAAPIPKAAPLVKALQGYLTAREGRKAQEAAEEAKGMEADYAQRMLGRMQGGYTYQPDAELETQMAKRPEETLDQYTQRMQATPFVGRAAPVPEQTELGEITRQSQYRRAPEEVLGMASTSLGTAALKDRPVMAQRLAQMLETPKAEEFYAPTETDDGLLVQFGKGGGKRETGYKAPTKPMAGSSLSKLIAERDALPPNSPMRVMYDNAIAKETSNAPLIGKIDLGDKGSLLGQELYLKKIDSLEAPARNAGRILNQVNAMDKATQKGTFTGSMAPTATGAVQFLDSFGIKVQPEVLANTRAFQAASNQLVLDFMAANGGARGFTEKETAILQDAFPKIIDSPQARQQIADLLRNRALQDVEDYNFAIGEFGKTFPSVVTPYKPIDNEEIRYQRWRRSQGGG